MEIDIPRWLSCYLHRYLNLSRESGKLVLLVLDWKLIKLTIDKIKIIIIYYIQHQIEILIIINGNYKVQCIVIFIV